MIKKKSLIAVAVSTILLMIGCGYHFGPGNSNTDRSIRTVFVDHFLNNTAEAYLETYMRKGFMDELLKTHSFRLAPGREEADAVLKVEIKNLSVYPIAQRSDNIAAVQRILVVLDIALEDVKTKKTIWNDRNFSGTSDYNVDAVHLQATDTARKNALITLSKDTAERAFRMISSGF
ncbi:MAG: hypothetical protein JW943_12320 [Deltaproteobacteria bacterium]|nr:hypothetical protein [Deltaproteobacteria bacterium]